jgi:hypothetical protein
MGADRRVATNPCRGSPGGVNHDYNAGAGGPSPPDGPDRPTAADSLTKAPPAAHQGPRAAIPMRQPRRAARGHTQHPRGPPRGGKH